MAEKYSRELEIDVKDAGLNLNFRLKVDTRNKLEEIQTLLVASFQKKSYQMDGKKIEAKDFKLLDRSTQKKLDATHTLGTLDCWEMSVKFKKHATVTKKAKGKKKLEEPETPPPPPPQLLDGDSDSSEDEDEGDAPLPPPSGIALKTKVKKSEGPHLPSSSDKAAAPTRKAKKNKNPRSINTKVRFEEPGESVTSPLSPPPPPPASSPPASTAIPSGSDSNSDSDLEEPAVRGSVYNSSATKKVWAKTESKARCTHCRNLLAGKKGIQGGGGIWHPKCFICYGCNKPITKLKFLRTQGQNICDKTCLAAAKKSGRLVQKVCKKCKKLVSGGGGVKVDDDYYHPECHVCKGCKSRLQEEYAEDGGYFYCISCAQEL